MTIRSWLLATLVACGSHPPPPAPITNVVPPAPSAPTKPHSSDALGSFTTRSEPQANLTGTGSVRGKLTTKTHEPLAGATIVFDSPVMQGERVEISDEKGVFSLGGFAAGPYRVTVYFDNTQVSRSFEIATDRVTELVFADWDEEFRPAPEPDPKPALPGH